MLFRSGLRGENHKNNYGIALFLLSVKIAYETCDGEIM